MNTRTQTPALMLQGVSSNAGKSLLTCALGRIMQEDGHNPAPFKAQNMSSYSYELAGGKVISGAQALQAIACKREPEVMMNPVFLRPVSDLGSEVFALGRSMGIMRAREYQELKEGLFASVGRAYRDLALRAGTMLIEGAGSPVEINLKAQDISNMRMAGLAKAPVLLVADIDRGGAFAHLYGTFMLLEGAERARVKGFVLNKFRGDASLLAPAMKELTARTGVPFCGVVPYLRELGLPEEDSLGGRNKKWPGPRALDKALNRLAQAVRGSLDLPYIYSLLAE